MAPWTFPTGAASQYSPLKSAADVEDDASGKPADVCVMPLHVGVADEGSSSHTLDTRSEPASGIVGRTSIRPLHASRITQDQTRGCSAGTPLQPESGGLCCLERGTREMGTYPRSSCMAVLRRVRTARGSKFLTLQDSHAWRVAQARREGGARRNIDKRRDKSEKRLPTRGVRNKLIRGEHSGVIALARGPRQCPASRTIRILSLGKG
jgi:hypothetical protein